ncbi:phosphate ABC transporter substrate-binding protein PstS [Gloeocapsa sp. PCC 73106]|uniref:phosphate ABC transporter substrate-binding protein PstS n=1 Tax=Gloeocapsa sp. PCC 73106 TaxID=102232 RepID=UPI0002ACAC60|nr:phosphate ABC transporter substrate-binding protein PstS [Gloeocapsa sp. PCC 73106]ELR96566.1 phosphate ABC transporter, phosphate-binding protein [Gloeocapsa sp. PCC 73106]
MSQSFFMKRRNFLLAMSALSGSVVLSQIPAKKAFARVSITGSGASFPAPLYQRWFSEYNRINPNVQISFQSIGSGAGIEQFTQGITDFGASDVAMTDEEIAMVARGVVLLPMTAGSVVVVYNQPAVQDLKLSRQQLADVFLGNITNWQDLGGPDQAITVVARSDGSGTTAVFTKYLNAISTDWASRVGEGRSVSWPVGVASRGNEGVSATVQQTAGAIGFVELSFSQALGIPAALLENRAGNFVAATQENSAYSLSQVELPENLRAFIVDPEGDNSYPIVTYTWILANKTYSDAAKLEAFQGALIWCLNEGQAFAPDLGFIPLPANVVEKVTAAIKGISVG